MKNSAFEPMGETKLTEYDDVTTMLFDAIDLQQLDLLKLLLGYPEESQYQDLQVKQQTLYVERIHLALEKTLLENRREALEQFVEANHEDTDPSVLRQHLYNLLEQYDKMALQIFLQCHEYNIEDFISKQQGYYRFNDKKALEFIVVLDLDKPNQITGDYPWLDSHPQIFIKRCLEPFARLQAKFDDMQSEALEAMDLKGLNKIYQESLNLVKKRRDELDDIYEKRRNQLGAIEKARMEAFAERQLILENPANSLPTIFRNLNRKEQAVVLRQFTPTDITDSQGNTLLHRTITASHNSTDCLKFLLTHDLDLLAKNNHGETPLAIASRLDKPQQVALLSQAIQKKESQANEIAKLKINISPFQQSLVIYGYQSKLQYVGFNRGWPWRYQSLAARIDCQQQKLDGIDQAAYTEAVRANAKASWIKRVFNYLWYGNRLPVLYYYRYQEAVKKNFEAAAWEKLNQDYPLENLPPRSSLYTILSEGTLPIVSEFRQRTAEAKSTKHSYWNASGLNASSTEPPLNRRSLWNPNVVSTNPASWWQSSKNLQKPREQQKLEFDKKLKENAKILQEHAQKIDQLNQLAKQYLLNQKDTDTNFASFSSMEVSNEKVIPPEDNRTASP